MHPPTLDYIATLPAGPISPDGITLVHGSYGDEDEYVFVPGQALGGLLESPTDVTFFGHTHHQGGFSYRAGQISMIQLRPEHGANFASAHGNRTRHLLNPGSIAFRSEIREPLSYRRCTYHIKVGPGVPYDIAAVQKRMEKAGLPFPLIERIEWGWLSQVGPAFRAGISNLEQMLA